MSAQKHIFAHTLAAALASPARTVTLCGVSLMCWASAPSVLAGAGAPPQVDWRMLRPTNTGIPGDYTHTIFVDENDQPWVAAYAPFWESGGMTHFNGKSWEVYSRDDYPGVITSPRFNDIVKDASGIMWIASDTGLLRFDPSIGPASWQRYDQSSAPIPTSTMRDIALAPDGSMWIAAWHTPTGAGGLLRYQPATNTWQSWTTATGLPWGSQWPNWNAIENVAVTNDLDGGYTVWFESNALGVATWKNGQFQWFGVPSEILGLPQTLPIEIESQAPSDADGHIWLNTNHGRARRNPDGTFAMVGNPPGFISDVSRVFAMSRHRALATSYHGNVAIWDNGWQYLGDWGNQNHTYAFAEESSGAFWVGGIGGVARYENGFFQRYRKSNTGMLSFFMQAIDFAPDGRVFMNANAGPGIGGFDVFDGTVWTNVNDHNYGLGPPWGIPADNVQSLCFRANGRLAHTPGGQGLYEWDGAQHTQLIPQGYSLENLVEDSTGRLWMAGTTGGGLLLTGTTYTQINSLVPLIGWIEDISVDPVNDGWVWIAAGSLIHTNGVQWQSWPRSFFGLSIAVTFSAAAAHPDGTVWIGTYGTDNTAGVYHFNPGTGQFTHYSPANTPMPPGEVGNIEIAPDGSVWLSTFHMSLGTGGLTHFDGQNWTAYSMGSSPLLANQIGVLNSRSVAGGYELWVGTATQGIQVLTVHQAEVIGDVNGDGYVNADDLVAVILAWGSCAAPPTPCPADVNNSGNVDVDDLIVVILQWG
jgi:ligand-binding sensor domain-containing protein